MGLTDRCGNYTTLCLDYCGLAWISCLALGVDKKIMPLTRRFPRTTPGAGPTVRSKKIGLRPTVLREYFDTLSNALGPMNWWPAQTPFEVIVGAILTQSTAWVNVEHALANLRQARMLSPGRMEKVPEKRLARLIQPSGYFRQKAKKLKENYWKI